MYVVYWAVDVVVEKVVPGVGVGVFNWIVLYGR